MQIDSASVLMNGEGAVMVTVDGAFGAFDFSSIEFKILDPDLEDDLPSIVLANPNCGVVLSALYPAHLEAINSRGAASLLLHDRDFGEPRLWENLPVSFYS